VTGTITSKYIDTPNPDREPNIRVMAAVIGIAAVILLRPDRAEQSIPAEMSNFTIGENGIDFPGSSASMRTQAKSRDAAPARLFIGWNTGPGFPARPKPAQRTMSTLFLRGDTDGLY
jgi:hypothetical protein